MHAGSKSREGCLEFSVCAGGEVSAVFLREDFLKEKACAVRLRRLLRLMLEDALFETMAKLRISVEQVQIGPLQADWLRGMCDTYDHVARAMGNAKAFRFHYEFERVQQRLGATEATTVQFLGNGFSGISYYLLPLMEEVGRRLRGHRAHGDYLTRKSRRERTQLAREIVEAHIAREFAAGRISEKMFTDFCAAPDAQEGMRLLFSRREFIRLNKEITAAYVAAEKEPIEVVQGNDQITLSRDGAFVFEEIALAALRRSEFLPVTIAPRQKQAA